MCRKTVIFLLFIISGLTARTQLCQGSLGDPIVNINFGSGNNPGPPLAAATTNYNYVSLDCPADGNYSVRNNSGGCFGNTWHTVTSDHTGGSGYFMLVNASFQPSAFYVDTVNIFCSNTTYEFAAWVMNMAKAGICGGNPIQPNLTFSIERTDGSVLQSYNSGNIASESSPSWKQFGFFFTAPSGVNRIVLRITNNAVGGCGNDLALDDITFRPCGPLLTSSIQGSGNTRNLCEGEAAQVGMNVTLSPGYTDPYLQWQKSSNGITWLDIPGANSTSYTADFPAGTSAGDYRFRVAVSKPENITIPACRVNSPVLTVKLNALPVTTVSNSGPVCERSVGTLSATGGNAYGWTGPGSFSATGATVQLNGVTAGHAGRYYVEVTNAAGCRRTDSTSLIVHPTPDAVVNPGNISICPGNGTGLLASGGTVYRWFPSAGLSSATVPDPFAVPDDTTVYRVEVSNNFSCKDTASVTVNVIPPPVASAGNDQSVMEGRSVRLNGKTSGANLRYFWTPSYFISDANDLQPYVSPVIDTAYILHVISNDGCGTDVDSVRIRVFKKVVIPNAFSPNGDGINDQWVIPALTAYSDFELNVYNRYGQAVFSTRKARPWNGEVNGKPLPVGTYYYALQLKETGQVQTGWVMIVK